MKRCLILLFGISVACAYPLGSIADTELEASEIAAKVSSMPSEECASIRTQINSLVLSAKSPRELLDAKCLLAAYLLRTGCITNIDQGTVVAREIIGMATNSWHSDWCWVYLASCDSVRGRRTDEIASLKAAIEHINVARLANCKATVLAKLTGGQSAAMVPDLLKSVLVGAYCNVNRIEEASAVCQGISDVATRKAAMSQIHIAEAKRRK